ncbi:MAG: hypothetical protein ACXVIH_03160 [Ilumatobacteraceae bacterium]
MRIDRLAMAAAALVASTVLIGCGSSKNSNTPSTNPTITTSGGIATTPLVVNTTTPSAANTTTP